MDNDKVFWMVYVEEGTGPIHKHWTEAEARKATALSVESEGNTMNAKARLLTFEEMKALILWGWCSPETRMGDIAIEPWVEAIRDAQDAQTLEALWPIVEVAARHPCVSPNIPSGRDCGNCATCQARELLAEMNAPAKGKEG